MQINEITVTGNLTKDPEVKYIANGTPVCNLYIAVNRTTKVKGSDEMKKEVVFINVVVWGKEAERCGETLVKGTEILVIGRLTQRSWEAQDGTKKSVIEILGNHVIPTPKKATEEGGEV